MDILIADIEADGLDPTEIFMVGIVDFFTDEFTAYVGPDEVPLGLMRLMEADIIVGHYFKGYDAKQIRRLTGGLVDIPNEKIEDTVEMSRKLFPRLENHKLKTWGEILGYPKFDAPHFDKFTPEMIPYCERDVRLNKVLYEFLLNQLNPPAQAANG